MKNAKRILCLMLTLTLVLTLAACGNDGGSGGKKKDRDNHQRGNQVGDRAYSGELHSFGPNGMAITTFDPTELGVVTVLNFWAYWCGPCVNEMPHFDRVAEEYADEVAIVAIHCDNQSKAQEFVGENYPDSAIRFAKDADDDPYAYYEKLGGSGSIPYTVVLDADGIIRNIFTGAITYEALVDAIEACLDGKKATTTTTTGTREPALKRGNQVGNVCYDSALDVITADGIQVETIDPTAYGKVTVITFWYTANTPCVTQLPAFDAIAKKYESSIKVVTVHGMLPQTAPAYIAEHYSNSPMVFLCDYIPDGGEEFDRNGYFTMLGGVDNAYPYTVVLNEKSVITHIFRTAITQEQLETAVLEALGRM